MVFSIFYILLLVLRFTAVSFCLNSLAENLNWRHKIQFKICLVITLLEQYMLVWITNNFSPMTNLKIATKKWHTSVIFKKLLGGHFGILMCLKVMGGKNIALQGFAKIGGLLQVGSILHRLSPPVPPTNSSSTQIYQDSQYTIWQHQKGAAITNTRGYLAHQCFWNVITVEWLHVWYDLIPIWQNPEKQCFFSTQDFRDIRIPKWPYKSFLKMPVVAIFRFAREKLLVTVTFDHLVV